MTQETKSDYNLWTVGAQACKQGVSLSQAYKKYVPDRYDHDSRFALKSGWTAMRAYLELKSISDSFDHYGIQ